MDGIIKKVIGLMGEKQEPQFRGIPARTATENNTRVDSRGRAVFPPGVVEIGSGCFEGSRTLRSVVLPETVKQVGVRAFADCPLLESVKLNEGLEELESNVFCGCRSLRKLVIPDSVCRVDHYFCRGTHFLDLVCNASGDRLYHYPKAVTWERTVLPATIRRICRGAFLDNDYLKELILPDGLETVEYRAIMSCGLRRLTIPASVKKVEKEAFFRCEKMEQIDLLCDTGAVESGALYGCGRTMLTANGCRLTFEEELRIRNISLFARPVRVAVPERDFWRSPVYRQLSEGCSRGDTGAMMAFADYFERLGEGEFYGLAANFWRARAYLLGNEQAAVWRKNWLMEHERKRIPVAADPLFRFGDSGTALRALGVLMALVGRAGWCLLRASGGSSRA